MRCRLFAVVIYLGLACSNVSLAQPLPLPQPVPMNNPTFHDRPDYKEYLTFFEKVYDTIDQNYYLPIHREAYTRFLSVFDAKIYPQLHGSGKTVKFIKWRSSAYLIDFLKEKDDIFSAFYPPTAAKEYEETALGKKIDLGIEGDLTAEGFLVSRVEPRSDAFEKGLRSKDLIRRIDDTILKDLTKEKVQELLNPLENTKVMLIYLAAADQKEKKLEVISKEYFKQTVFMVPVDVPGIYCLQIQRFNQKTSEDMTNFMVDILKGNPKGLIIDLRGNPGGPPLAAREISAFFLPPKEEFAYFQKKNRPKAALDVPEIPSEYWYKGEVVILVNEKSGSASELFTGVLQQRRRATVMGTNTAGQVFLKSMFHFDDDSMVLLVTARGHYPDGEVFSFQGITPNKPVSDPSVDLVKYAAEFLISPKKSVSP